MLRSLNRNRYLFDIVRDDPVIQDLEPGLYEVIVRTEAEQAIETIRLSMTRGEVGNGNSHDGSSNPLVFPGQDGGLAVRMQAYDGAGAAVGGVSRFSDEGVIFRTQSPEVKFDVRDVPGPSSGLFDVVILGDTSDETYDLSLEHELFFVNAGAGNDVLIGSRNSDYLIGAAGNDVLYGHDGDDILIGAPGDDLVYGGAGNDIHIVRPYLDHSDRVDLGDGADVVNVLTAGQVRLTWSTLQTGDGNSNDSNALAGEDGGLAIRFQAEDANGNLIGPVSRYDDEGISFVAVSPGMSFDLRNLPDGAVRGSGYGIVRLGSAGDDVYNDSAASRDVFHNGGRGNDTLIGGSGNDHLVGLAGDDRIEGGAGNDLLVGLAGVDTFVFSGTPGSDTILTYEAGVDRIDLSAYGIGLDDIETEQVGANAFVRVDTNGDDIFDFQIFLGGTTPPLEGDFIF